MSFRDPVQIYPGLICVPVSICIVIIFGYVLFYFSGSSPVHLCAAGARPMDPPSEDADGLSRVCLSSSQNMLTL